MTSKRPIKMRPVVAAKESTKVTQYSPAPVTKMRSTRKHPPHRIPVRTSFRSIFVWKSWLRSKMFVMTPSMVPNWEPSPRARSMRKNSTAQNGEPGSSTMAWVKTINANPVPSAAYWDITTEKSEVRRQINLYFSTRV